MFWKAPGRQLQYRCTSYVVGSSRTRAYRLHQAIPYTSGYICVSDLSSLFALSDTSDATSSAYFQKWCYLCSPGERMMHNSTISLWLENNHLSTAFMLIKQTIIDLYLQSDTKKKSKHSAPSILVPSWHCTVRHRWPPNSVGLPYVVNNGSFRFWGFFFIIIFTGNRNWCFIAFLVILVCEVDIYCSLCHVISESQAGHTGHGDILQEIRACSCCSWSHSLFSLLFCVFHAPFFSLCLLHEATCWLGC